MMSNISFQVIPFAFIFIIILFFLASKKNVKEENHLKKKKTTENFDEHRVFFENAEKKLLALKELYKQDLIDLSLYIKKTELVASSINKLTGKNIQELIKLKKVDIYEQLKDDISKKVKTIPSKKDIGNLEQLIKDVDKKIETGLNYER